MSFAKARFVVSGRGRRTGVLLTMDECRHALDDLNELEAFRLQGRVWVPSHDPEAELKLTSQPHPARQIILDVLEGRARRYLTDERGKRLGVILSSQDYETTCRALEDLEDIKAIDEFDAAGLRGDPDTETIPIERAFPELARRRA